MLVLYFFVLIALVGTTTQFYAATTSTTTHDTAQIFRAIGEREKNLLVAAEKDNTTFLLSFVTMGTDPNQLLDVTQITPLHAAAISNAINVVMLLLANRADVNCVDNAGWTPLMWAAKQGHIDVVKILLANDANPALYCTAFKRTALHIAVLAGHEAIVAELVDTNSTLNAQDKNGWSALMHAVNHGNIALIKKLLYRDMSLYLATDLLPCANANVKAPETGLTALHVAVLRRHNGIMHMLIGARSNLDEVTREGKTALHLAALTNNHNAIRILRKAGAKQDIADSSGMLAAQYATKAKAIAEFDHELEHRKQKPVPAETPAQEPQAQQA